MAFSDREFKIIFTTFGLTALFAFGTSYMVSKTIDIGCPTAPGTAASERTTKTDARNLQTQYLASDPLKVQYTNTSGDVITDSLKGFVFSAHHLDEIIHRNFYFSSGSTDMPDEVLFLLGQDGEFSDYDGRKYGNIRLTAIGMKDRTLLDEAAAGTIVSLFDKADPCPPNCPE